MNKKPKLLPFMVDYIKSFEGWRKKAYLDSANVWTIGWGTTKWFDGYNIKEGMVITKEICNKLFNRDINNFSSKIFDFVKVKLSDHQFSSLVSFTYNVGIGNFSRSTLLKKLNKGMYKEAAAEFSKWVKVRNRKTNKWTVLKGLVLRRKKEMKVFLTPDTIKISEFRNFVDNIKARSYTFIYKNKFNILEVKERQ